jgi:hypothetical protein
MMGRKLFGGRLRNLNTSPACAVERHGPSSRQKGSTHAPLEVTIILLASTLLMRPSA